jgi:septal ring factor EnvC (AmiA/AmiB activator)
VGSPERWVHRGVKSQHTGQVVWYILLGMSLTKDDLNDIRTVVLDALDVAVNPRLDRIEAQLDEHSETLAEHTSILNEHTRILNEHGHRLTRVENKLETLDGRIQALEADIKELYALIGTSAPLDKDFTKLSSEQQVQKLYAAVISLADQLHVALEK